MFRNPYALVVWMQEGTHAIAGGSLILQWLVTLLTLTDTTCKRSRA